MTLLIDLSKVYDFLPHKLLLAKLNACGCVSSSLEHMKNYLSDRDQTVKTNSSFSHWTIILCNVPQGSILGPLLFKVFLCDLFLVLSDIDILWYADDNTLYAINKSTSEVLRYIETTSEFYLVLK